MIDVAVSGKTQLFAKLFVFTIVYILFLCIVNYLSSLVSKYLTEKMLEQYRKDVFQGIMSRQPAAYYEETTADYVSAMTNDMKLIEENYIVALLSTFELLIMFTATFGLLIALSPLVTVILVLALLLMFLVPAGIGRVLEKRQDLVSKQMSVFTGKLKELFSGYEVLKSYNRIENAILRFQDENEKEIHTSLSTIAVIFVSAYLVLIGHITMGTLLALVQLSSSFMAPVILLMQNIPKIQSMKSVIARLDQYAECGNTRTAGKGIPTFERSIEFRHVSFSYSPDTDLLSDISFKLERGKKYAIMGQSGCGKSTLLKLLTGYLDSYQGAILYDGQELQTLNPNRTTALSAVIHQNVYLFHESVRENILLHEEFTDQELASAVEKSGVSMFLSEKDGGLEYVVGENGGSLSGGQKQRITLARALIRHAPLLILDEGTSALDKRTAHEIENHLLKNKDITLLTITHNPNADLMMLYDEIYHMEDGKLEKQSKTIYTD